MASRGFEFAYRLDGGNGTPLARDFILGAAAAHKVGDLMYVHTDGTVLQCTTPAAEVVGVMAESVAAADITAGTTLGKMWIIESEQVWRCSMNAASTAFIVGFTKTIDTVDCNTISATDSTGGRMILVDKSELDDEGNVLAYVVFADTGFGGA